MYIRNAEGKQIKIIILMLRLIVYILVSTGAICVIVVKKLSFFEVAQILPIVIGTIEGIIISIVGRKK